VLVLAGSYPVNGEWTEDQVLVYELVLDLQTKGISMMQPGADYPTVSAELRSYFNRLLLKAGFVQGELSGLDANSISTYFCPHGFVHHVGAQHTHHIDARRTHATHTCTCTRTHTTHHTTHPHTRTPARNYSLTPISRSDQVWTYTTQAPLAY
jgi:Xaa-Pro aminopeptidase